MILLLHAEATGAQLIAHIFQEHGIWFGQCTEGDMFNPHGDFKNRNISMAVHDCYGSSMKGTVPVERRGFMGAVCDILVREGYMDGEWAFLADAVHKNCFDNMKPFKVAIRSEGARKGSWLDHSDRVDENGREIIRSADDLLASITYQVDPQRVLAGDYRVLEVVLGCCNIRMDKAKVDAIVKLHL